MYTMGQEMVVVDESGFSLNGWQIIVVDKLAVFRSVNNVITMVTLSNLNHVLNIFWNDNLSWFSC